MSAKTDRDPTYSLLGKVEGAEKLFLAGRRSREADMESAVTFFLEFLWGFESFDFDQPCVTVFGSSRYAVMTGGAPGLMDAAIPWAAIFDCRTNKCPTLTSTNLSSSSTSLFVR